MSYDTLYQARPDRILWGDRPGRLVARINEFLPPGSLILDAGCGDGKNALYLEQQGYRVLGFDASSYALEGLRNRFRKAEARVRGIYDFLDVETYLKTYSGERVDGLVSYGLFHCLPPHRRIPLHLQLQDHLKPGGYLFFATMVDGVPLPAHHQTEGITLASLDEVDRLFKNMDLRHASSNIIEEDHFPAVGKHQHHVMRVIVRKLC